MSWISQYHCTELQFTPKIGGGSCLLTWWTWLLQMPGAYMFWVKMKKWINCYFDVTLPGSIYGKESRKKLDNLHLWSQVCLKMDQDTTHGSWRSNCDVFYAIVEYVGNGRSVNKLCALKSHALKIFTYKWSLYSIEYTPLTSTGGGLQFFFRF